MSKYAAEKHDEPTAQEGSKSALAQTERLFLRLTFWQTLLSVAGVFIAVVALYAALSESSAVRQQTAATDLKQNKPKICQNEYWVDRARSKSSLGLLSRLNEQYGIEAR